MMTKHYDVHCKYVQEVGLTFSKYFLKVMLGTIGCIISAIPWYFAWRVIHFMLPPEQQYGDFLHISSAMACFVGFAVTMACAIVAVISTDDKFKKD